MRLYLAAYLFFLSLPLGSISFLKLHSLTGGRWGALRPDAERLARATPLCALFFLPVALGLEGLYPWMHPGHDPQLLHRAALFTPAWFWGRAALYFLGWSLLAWWPSRPAAGLVLHLALTSLMAVDWVMSLDPHFASSIFGLQVTVLQAVLALAFLTLRQALRRADPGVLYDLGGMLLAAVMLNAYMGFSQLVIVWAGDLSSQDPYYLQRLWGPWGAVAGAIFLAGLLAPFLCLMWGGLKRDPRRLGPVAGLVLAMGMVEWLWLVVPHA